MLVASILLLLSLLVYYLLGRKDETVITCLPTNRNRALLQECQTVKSYDNIPVWGFNGHIQSYFASQIRKGPTYPFERYGAARLPVAFRMFYRHFAPLSA